MRTFSPHLNFARTVALTLLALASLAAACNKKPAEPPPQPGPPIEEPAAAAPATKSTVCAADANAIGVGKACAKADDCKGQLAVECPRAQSATAWDFCTRACAGGDTKECGDGAVCVGQGRETSRCVPASCAAALALPMPTDVSLSADCHNPPNRIGVGKACTTHADCNGNSGAKFCPRVIDANEPSWCSMLCKNDSDCGEGGFCWYRQAVEKGQPRVVSSCALLSCKPAAVAAPAAATPPAAAQ